jgi:diguanylate cyclase (GGDEF)-like protein
VTMDIDHFKHVNDTYGHGAGDEVLAELGARLGRGIRGGDVLTRVGGEEFTWVLPGSTARQARDAAKRMRRTVSELPIEPAGRVTLSAGVADLAMDEGDARALLRLADAALYEAKGGGRDTTVVACAELDPEGVLPPYGA